MVDLKGSYIPYFRELDDSQIKEIESILTVYSCKSGDIIYLQGEFCPNWVIINKGNFLSRERDGDVVIEETVLLEGQSFDFESAVKNSITSRSLEALEDSSIIVINILSLKTLAKKRPIISSLIKSMLGENKKSWEEFIMNSKSSKKLGSFKVKRSNRWVVLKTVPIFLMLSLMDYVLYVVFLHGLNFSFFLSLFLLWISTYTLCFINSRLCFIELNREQIVKREFSVKKISSTYESIPIDKVKGTSTLYSKRLLRLFRIGEVVIESPTNNLSLQGVYKPEVAIAEISNYTSHTVSIDKAIELASFKNLYSKNSGYFYIETNLEADENSIFTFRKSILYFLVRATPPFLVFLLISIGFVTIFEAPIIYIMNIPTLVILLWKLRDWGNDKYSFEGDKIISIEKTPLWGRERRTEADITSVMSVKKDQKHFFQLLFNYGDIEVDTFGGKIVYPSIHNPDKVIDNLYIVKKYFYSKKRNMEKIERQEEFLSFTKYYQELAEK